ncbi:uncharacterized protein J5M81_013536 [Pluvialis apricaria]
MLQKKKDARMNKWISRLLLVQENVKWCPLELGTTEELGLHHLHKGNMQLTPSCHSEGGKILVLNKVEIEGLTRHLIYLAGLAGMTANCISAPRSIEGDCQ